jgi:NitT/TauT family transport system ATP-binding protein
MKGLGKMVSSQSYKLESAQPALTISGLRFSFQSLSSSVIHDLSLTVRRGEIVAILGRSGCGKSTLLNLIAGLIKPQSGEIVIGKEQQTNRAIGYIFQEDALLPWRTVGANLSLAKDIGGVAKDSFQTRLRDFLSSFHLHESILQKYPSQLSGGMKQRVSIIQTLLFNPSLLLLDEPFSALDFYTRLSLEAEFYNLVRSRGITALLVTHDIEEAIALSDRIILLSKSGTVQADIAIAFDCLAREPESVRGLPEFGQYYRAIWEQFKAVGS